jgi:nucleotide-binding universal stress UspA family protein
VSDDLLSRPLLPVANETDAADTCAVAFPRIAAAGGRPLVVTVIEKAGGAPDRASVEQREAAAEAAFAAARTCAERYDLAVDTEIRYGTDVARVIVEAATDADASAIVFHPAGGSWLSDLLTGDVSDRLLAESDRPVVVLPEATPATDAGDAGEGDG